MRDITGWLLAPTVGLALINWWSRWRDDRRLERWTKPAVTAGVIALAATIDADPSAARLWCIAALAACLVGDVLLLPSVNRFREGLFAFAVGHLLFVGCALTIGVRPGAAALAATALAVVVAAVGVPMVRNSGSLRGPVVGYLAVITAMAALLIGTMRPLLVIGAVSFVVSDAVLGWNRFVRTHAAGPVVVMVTYHVALAAIALGIA